MFAYTTPDCDEINHAGEVEDVNAYRYWLIMVKDFCTEHGILSRSMAKIFKALKKVIVLYNGQGFLLKFVHTDSEFEPLEERLRNRHITMNIATANEHVPKVERIICLI